MERLPNPAVKKTSSFRYAIGMFGTSIPINMFKTYAVAYYVEMQGLSSSSMGTIFMIYAFVDAIDNPVYGYLSDHTRSKWGRRRPWLVIGTPLLILLFIMFFSVPSAIAADKQALFYYAMLTYILTGTLDSLINANYGALFPELFQEDTKRTKTNAMRQAFQLVAMAISIALTPMVTGAIGYQKTAIIYGILALAVILYCTFGCHENPAYQELEKPSLWRTLWDLVRMPKFWLYGLSGSFYAAAFSMGMSAIPLYIRYVIKAGNTQTTILMGTVLGVALLGVALWSFVVKKVPLLYAWRTALLMMCLGFIPMYSAESLGAAMGIAVIIALGAAGTLATQDVIGAKIMDEDFKKHGIRREGIFSSALGVLNRLNGLFTGVAFKILESQLGYISGDQPGPNPGMAAKYIFVVFPCIAMALSFLFALLLRFPKEKPEEIPSQVE